MSDSDNTQDLAAMSPASTGSVLRGRAALLLECQEHIAVGTHGRMNIHSLADELNEAAAVIESLSAQLSSLRKTAATLMEIAASGADPKIGGDCWTPWRPSLLQRTGDGDSQNQ